MNEINFEIKDVEKIDLSMDVGVKEIFPPIENLEVTPTKEQQVFNHENSYGYDEVIVDPIPDEYIIPDGTLEITENITYDVTPYSRVNARVYPTPTLQDKSITITENGTQNITFDEGYDGLNSVEVITNVESGGDGAINITSTSEMDTKIKECMDSFINHIQKKPNTYDVFTDEPVTLYSPAEGYNKYVIRYRTSGQYCVVWFPDSVLSLKELVGSAFSPSYPQVNTFSSKTDWENTNISFINTVSATGYTYSSYSTLENCIEAMKSPTTSYSIVYNSSNWGFDSQSSGYYMFPMTNIPYFNKNNELQHGRRISSNETIVFKQ